MQSFTTTTEALSWDFSDIGDLMEAELFDRNGTLVQPTHDGYVPKDVDVDDCVLRLEFPDKIHQRFLAEPELGNPADFHAYVMLEDPSLADFNEVVADFSVADISGGKTVTVALDAWIHSFGYYTGFDVRWYVVPVKDRPGRRICETTHAVFESVITFPVYRDEGINIDGLTLPFEWTDRYKGSICIEPLKSGNHDVTREPLDSLIAIVGNEDIKVEKTLEWAKKRTACAIDMADIVSRVFDYVLSNIDTVKDDDGNPVIIAPAKGSAHEWLANSCRAHGYPFEDWVHGIQDQNTRLETVKQISQAIQIESGINVPESYN